MKKKKLGECSPGERGTICTVGNMECSSEILSRLLEMGLIEGSTVELIHEAPFGGDPIAVRVRGALIALRRSEANLVEVQYE